eukprot:GDKK01025751.1.p1 GENE.GDKK01025751.1~~GDKK01025751.1.p1  ORF type:complete len:146 (-),score=3.08 GDKK01025751.1:31-468(-)
MSQVSLATDCVHAAWYGHAQAVANHPSVHHHVQKYLPTQCMNITMRKTLRQSTMQQQTTYIVMPMQHYACNCHCQLVTHTHSRTQCSRSRHVTHVRAFHLTYTHTPVTHTHSSLSVSLCRCAVVCDGCVFCHSPFSSSLLLPCQS